MPGARAGDQSGIGRQLEAQLAACAARLSPEQKLPLVAWLRQVAPDLFAARLVRPLQRYIGSLTARQVTYASSSLSSSENDVKRV